MQIIQKLDDFLYTIFPSAKQGDQQSLLNAVKEYYTYGPYKPKVTIDNDLLIVDIDTPTILAEDSDYKKVIALCAKGKYSEAQPILKYLIEKNPTISEYHRIMGQIRSDEGDQEEAINCLIDALRWDPKNGWALLLMGNIFAKYKDDVSTAMKYYDQALHVNPKDNIAINNIGANLMQRGKLEEAEKYFWEAVKINDKYPNTHYALGMIAEMKGDLDSGFFSTIQAIKLNQNRDGLYQNSVKQAFEIARKITATDTGKKIVQEYLHKLELRGNRKIDLTKDQKLPTAAKIEFAENYDRDTHVVKYKASYPAVEHLIMHELVHLDFVIEARKDDLNQLFTSNQEHKKEFIKGLEPTIRRLKKMGFAEKSIADYCSNLFDGMNRQIFNAPVDLFIEDFLYNEFPELRPFQFISLYTMLQEGIKAVTDKKIVELSPKDILSKSKIYNLLNAIQFRELYGFDFITDFHASPNELKLANEFYEEYLQYKDDREPAEEYELVLHWAEDLKLDKNFELINEQEYRTKRTNLDNLLISIEKDPYDIESKNPYKERELSKFQKSQEDMGTNMAVVMFMVDALQFFEGMPKEEVKKIAFEIALQGTQGYRPDKDDYRINSIKGKTFSGYHILAYYYVSWALSIPEMLSQLQLPYDQEYKIALTMYNPNK